MSKNKQILIFSGIGLAVLGGVTAVLMLTAPEKPSETPEDETVTEEIDESLILTEKAAADVVSVNVVVLHKAVAEEEAAVVASTVAVHHLISRVQFGNRGYHERIFVFFVFPGGLTRAGMIDHVR